MQGVRWILAGGVVAQTFSEFLNGCQIYSTSLPLLPSPPAPSPPLGSQISIWCARREGCCKKVRGPRFQNSVGHVQEKERVSVFKVRLQGEKSRGNP